MPEFFGRTGPTHALSRPHNPQEVFVGREAEIARLREQAQKAAAGITQLAVIEGQAGIGKSRLLQEAFSDLTGWRQLYVRLDVHDQARTGATAWRALHNGEEPAEKIDATIAEQVVSAIEIADSIDEPMIIVVEDLHWIDDVSAEVLWRVTRALDKYPGLLVTTMRPSDRPHLRRVAHFAQASPEASYFPLEPLSIRETQIFLQARVGLPLTKPTVALLHRETDGFPLHLDAVGRWLAQAPEDRRTLKGALARLHENPDSRLAVFERAIAASIETTAPDIGDALLALAVASKPLSATAFGALLGHPLDHDALLATAMVRWRPQERQYEIEHKNVAQAIRRTADPERLADWHLRLRRGDDSESLRHRVRARVAHPARVDLNELIADLRKHGERALAEQRGGDVVDLLLAAARMDPSAESITLALRAIIQSESFAQITELETVLSRIRGSMLKSAALALLELHRNDLLAAYREMNSVFPEWNEDPEVVLIYAEAVSRIGRQAAAAGFFGQGESFFSRALGQLNRVCELAEDAEPAVAQRWIAAVESYRAVISFWQLLEHGDPAQISELPDCIRELLSRLEETPGTKGAQSTLHAMLGERLRQMGDRAGAAKELTIALTEQDGDAVFDVYAQAQLALMLFEAALWDEAYAASEQALAYTVDYGEDVSALATYAISALILGARGEHEAAQGYLQRIEKSPDGMQSPVVRVLLDYALAWSALCDGDQEETAAAMLRIVDNDLGWVMVGIVPVTILARALLNVGRAEALPGLVTLIEDPRVPATDTVRAFAAAYLRALSARAMSSPVEAMSFFLEALEHIDTLPPLRPTISDGNGLRLFRALLALDIADHVAANRGVLDEERERALVLASWAANTFHRCGAGLLKQQAADHAEELRSWRTATAAIRTIPRAREPRVRPTENFAFEILNQLTSRERQIALLVGEGQTNREIATELVLSVRTVEYHVANVLAKLEVRSRVELRRMLRIARAGVNKRRG